MPMDNSTGKWTKGERELTANEVFTELTDIQDKIQYMYQDLNDKLTILEKFLRDDFITKLSELSSTESKVKTKGDK